MSRQREYGQFDGGAGTAASRRGRSGSKSRAGSRTGTRSGSGSQGGTGGGAPTVNITDVRRAMGRGRAKKR